MKWVGSYADDQLDGERRYVFMGANAVTNVYFYCRGRQTSAGAGASAGNHRDGLRIGSQLSPI